MVTRIITNHLKEGHQAAYVEASKAFCAALVAQNGCLAASVYVDAESGNVVNIEQWPDRATAEAVTGTDTFRTYLPQLIPHFAGNETVWLEKV